jgi:hypothetical protein
MHDFITLEIEEPVAGTGGLGDIGLMGMFHAPGVLFEVPDGMNDTDLVRPDTPDLFQGIVIGVAIPEGDDKFVNDREDRANGLSNRVIEFGGIAHHGKSTNGHIPVFIIYWIGGTTGYRLTNTMQA